MSRCDPLVTGAADGVAAALAAVDCMAGEATGSAFSRLFGPQGALLPVLTALLTLYVAGFALALLTGRTRLGIAALTPRMLLLGLVLTFATSWVAYRDVIWNLFVGAPDQVAGLLMGTPGEASRLFAGRIDVLFQAIADTADLAGQQAAAGQADPTAAATAAAPAAFAPASLVWLSAVLLLLGTVGLMVTARIVLAVLLALGPVFIVLGLFTGTRGLTAGWLRALAMTAAAPLLAVLGGGLTIELAVPVVQRLAGPDGIAARPAFALFLIAAVHCALMALALRTAATLVGGWRVFGLAPDERGREPRPAAAMPSHPHRTGPAATTMTAVRPPMPAHSAAPPANDHARSGRPLVRPALLATDRTAAAPPPRTLGLGNRWRRPAVRAELLR